MHRPQGPHEWPAVLEWIRRSGEFQIAGNLDAHAPGFSQSKHGCEGRLIQACCRVGPAGVVDQDLHRDLLDPRRIHQELIVLDLEIEEHVQVGEALHQAVGVLVVIIAVDCWIDRCTDDALRLQCLQRRGIGVEIHDRDTLEAAFAFGNRIEHAGVIALITRVRLHQQRVLHAMRFHHFAELRGGADFLRGRPVDDIFAKGEIDRIDHMRMAVDLRLVKNIHRDGTSG